MGLYPSNQKKVNKEGMFDPFLLFPSGARTSHVSHTITVRSVKCCDRDEDSSVVLCWAC